MPFTSWNVIIKFDTENKMKNTQKGTKRNSIQCSAYRSHKIDFAKKKCKLEGRDIEKDNFFYFSYFFLCVCVEKKRGGGGCGNDHRYHINKHITQYYLYPPPKDVILSKWIW